MKAALLAALVLVPTLAHAEERSTSFSIGAMTGGFERSHQEFGDHAEGVWGPRITLAFEHAPLAYPESKGYRFGGALVPELFGGALVQYDRAEAFIGAGLRAELQIAQTRMGLLEVSARGAVYIAARGLVLGDERKGFAEFAVGEYWILRNMMRIGFEASVIVGRDEPMADYGMRSNVGGVVALFLGWGPS